MTCILQGLWGDLLITGCIGGGGETCLLITGCMGGDLLINYRVYGVTCLLQGLWGDLLITGCMGGGGRPAY